MSATPATIQSTGAGYRGLRSSPAHVVPLHYAVAGLELEPSGQLPGEGPKRLAVVAAEEQAVRVVLPHAPRREAQAPNAGQIRCERLRTHLVGLPLHPHRPLARLRRVVDALDQVPGHRLATRRATEAGRPAPGRAAGVVARRVVDEPARTVHFPHPAEGRHPAAHGYAGLLSGPDVPVPVSGDHLDARPLVELQINQPEPGAN